MKIDHITYLSNNSSIRDTQDIHLTTIQYLEKFKITGTAVLDFPDSELQVKITNPGDGTAAFDMMKNERTGIVNFCCFDSDRKDYVLDLIRDTVKSPIRTPDTDLFMFSLPIDQFAFPPKDWMLCGEVEFYIWYMLYLAYKEK